MVLVGDAKDKVAILIDDMADTCGTIVQVNSIIKYFVHVALQSRIIFLRLRQSLVAPPYTA
jgi:hypothetical protein